MATDAPSGRLAFDIETISPSHGPDEEVDMDNPDHFEIAAIGFAYEGPDAGETLPETEVLLRDQPGARGEHEFLGDIGERLLAYDPAETVSFGGDFFDIPMLMDRPPRAGNAVGEGPDEDRHGGLKYVLQDREHTDLADPAANAYGFGTSLEDLIEHQGLNPRPVRFEEYAHGLDVESVRPTGATGPVENTDIFTVLEHYLHARSPEADPVGPCDVAGTEELIQDYILGDIEHLLTLADRRPF